MRLSRSAGGGASSGAAACGAGTDRPAQPAVAAAIITRARRRRSRIFGESGRTTERVNGLTPYMVNKASPAARKGAPPPVMRAFFGYLRRSLRRRARHAVKLAQTARASL